ncbi:MAG TPA: DUF2065 domain-containing protein [Desulfomonilaceae bacterium]|nr:DUF2065 domain-containing protein [Desulfomonilaceae bacterium]
MEYFLCVIGMVMVVEGLPYFGFPEKMKELMKFIQDQENSTLRVMGGMMIAAGLSILVLARWILGAS